MTLHGADWLASRPRRLTPGTTPEPQMRDWVEAEPVWTVWRRKTTFATAANRTKTPRTSSQQPGHYTDYAVSGSIEGIIILKCKK